MTKARLQICSSYFQHCKCWISLCNRFTKWFWSLSKFYCFIFLF